MVNIQKKMKLVSPSNLDFWVSPKNLRSLTKKTKMMDLFGHLKTQMFLKWLSSLKLATKAPENWWLEDEFLFKKAYFQVLTVSFGESN